MKEVLENWVAVLAIMGGLGIFVSLIFVWLLVWKKSGGGDIKAGPVDIDVDGKQ